MRALQRRSAGTARKASGKPRGAPAAARPVNPARLAVARAYLAFLNGGALAEAPPRNLHGEADRRLFAQLLRGMVRHKLLLEAELERLANDQQQPRDPAVHTAALLGLYQLRFLERVPDHAAVFESVEVAAALGFGKARGWVNAVLRRAQREGSPEGWPQALPLGLRTSHPDWMVARWRARYGEARAARICEANNLAGGTVLRVETGRTSPRELLRALAGESVAATPHPLLRSAIKVDQVGPLLRSHAFSKGHCYVQDVASQLLLAWMAPLFSGRVLDACAAPGGKLTWLAGLRAEDLLPLGAELSAERLGLIRENFARLRLPPVPLLRADGRRLPIRLHSLDGLLLDVPCSATGMIRKYPELKWRKRESDLAGYTRLQAALLDEGAPAVKGGGWLLYITCSLEPEENEQQVQAFLARHEDFRRRPFSTLPVPTALGEPERHFFTPAGDFQVLPAADRMGLYAALLEKVEPEGESAAGSEPSL